MDPIAHTLVGATLARTRLARGIPGSSWALVVAANLPDIDAFAYLAGSDAALAWRRGVTHGPIGVLVLPLLWLSLLRLWARWRNRRNSRSPSSATTSPGRLASLVYLAAFSHPALDWLNTYGVRLLMPFDERWFYGDVLYIVDPWFWLILAAGVYLATVPHIQDGPVPAAAMRSHRRRWSSVALLGTLVVLLAPMPAVAKSLWIGMLVAVALAARGLRASPLASPRRGERIAVAALSVWLVYLGSATLANRLARGSVEAEATARGFEVEDLLLGPLAGNPLGQDVLLQLRDHYRYGTYSLFREPHLELEQQSLRRPNQQELAALTAAAGTADPPFEGFHGWLRFPALDRIGSTDAARRTWLLDARYMRHAPDDGSPAASFGAVPITLPRLQSRQPED
jgi:inner membrane protein